MAAASAGPYQSGTVVAALTNLVPSSIAAGNVDSGSASVLHSQQQQQQQQHHHVQNEQQQMQSHQHQQHQQMLQALHQHQNANIQYHSTVPQHPQHQQQQMHLQQQQHHQQTRHHALPRVGNASHPPPPPSQSSQNQQLGNISLQRLAALGDSVEMLHETHRTDGQILTNKSNSGLNSSAQQMHQSHEILQQQSIEMPLPAVTAPNLAPGWRRLISNNEVIYISPSGAALRNHGQIKDYLLAPGTCKCGLPCPLRPEYFFEFNSQVPNIQLQIPLENGLPLPSSRLVCMHQRRFYENQQNDSAVAAMAAVQQQKDIKRRKIIDASGKISTSPIPQCNSVTVYSGNVMQASQIVGLTNSTTTRMPRTVTQHAAQHQQLSGAKVIQNTAAVNNVPTFHQSQSPQKPKTIIEIHQTQEQPELAIETIDETEDNKQIGTVTLSKTPPWRKNSILIQQQTSTPLSAPTQTSHVYATGNERVPPLPQAHLIASQPLGNVMQQPAPPWQGQTQNRFTKQKIPAGNHLIPPTIANKKNKPNFKEDPTGYLDQQTAILHSSILNVVQKQDPIDNVDESVAFETIETLDNESLQQQEPAILQNQSVVYGTNQIKLQQPISKQTTVRIVKSNTGQEQHIYQIQTKPNEQFANPQSQQQQVNRQVAPPGFTFSHQQQPRMVAPIHQMDMQKQSVTSQQNQRIINNNNSHNSSNGSGHQIIYTTSDGHPAQQQRFSINLATTSQSATTTTIGGQTVTHFPNGMVQVEQNCDNLSTSIPFKPQQQIQLQQQIQQHNLLFRQNQQLQQKAGAVANSSKHFVIEEQKSTQVLVPRSQESPVSSSTAFNRSTPESRGTPDSKGPAQVGAISTSNESPMALCPSPAESSESSNSSIIKPSPSQMTITSHHSSMPTGRLMNSQQGILFSTDQTTTGRNTLTSVTAGKTITATTSMNDKIRVQQMTRNPGHSSGGNEKTIIVQKITTGQHQHHNLLQGATGTRGGLQIQPVIREGSSNQLIMTSTGQLIMMSTAGSSHQHNKSPTTLNSSAGQQVIINSSGRQHNQQQQQHSVVINQQTLSQQQQGLNTSIFTTSPSQQQQDHTAVITNQSNGGNGPAGTNLIHQNSTGANQTGGLVIQNSQILQAGHHHQNIIQSSNGQNFIVNSSGNIQPVILNNSNIQIHQPSANILHHQSPTGSAKVISTGGNLINNQVLSSPLGQQTVVLNALPNSYVIQPNFATVDGQVVGQIVNQDTGTTSYIRHNQQQTQQQIILTSPDSKRKAKKRKSGSVSSSPSTSASLSPQQSPTMQAQQSPQPQGTMVQIASQYPTQQFQISPGIQGIAVMNKNQTAGPQQQILIQNGQIIQPLNLIGQQLLVPAGLVVAPDTTLLQIQNMGACGSIITPQGMMLRAPSPQNKNFLSPNGSGQQFIVSGNGQMSPMGQIYGTPMGLMMQQNNSGATTYVQQNTTIVQQQTTMMNSNEGSPEHSHQGSASPPDTTTHSPRSPERPSSEKSGGSDMVQMVSSSEPDSVVSPVAADSAQSPTATDYDRGNTTITFQTTANLYKSSDAKIRRIQTPSQYTSMQIVGNNHGRGNGKITPPTGIKPDSHESSPTTSPSDGNTVAACSTTTIPTSCANHTGTQNNNINNNNNNSSSNLNSSVNSNTSMGHLGGSAHHQSFCIGELVWGAARGHPAWPGKIVNPPDGMCTPSDSTWVQWFGGRPHVELVAINSLKSLSEGLDAHHKAQKDARKSRKLNSQLERAIQEAMTELDRISTMSQKQQTQSTVSNNGQQQYSTPVSSRGGKGRGRQSSNVGHQRTKPIKIAPAPSYTDVSSKIIQNVQGQNLNSQQLTTGHHPPSTAASLGNASK